MALAFAAVAAAKAADWRRQMREGSNELALLTADKRPGSEHAAGFRQIVDMPAYCFATAHVARNARSKPAWSFS
jgi:hypothetical protein